MGETVYRYSVVRYVDDPIKNEARNIGVLLQCRGASYVGCKFVQDVRAHVGHISSGLDLKMVRNYIEELSARFKPLDKPGPHLFQKDLEYLKEGYLESLAEKNLGKLAFTDPHGGITTDPQFELEELFRTFIGEERGMSKGPRHSRLKTQLRNEFRKRDWIISSQQGHRKGRIPVGFTINQPVQGGKSKVDHVVDFASRNGKWLIVEAVDMRLGSEKVQATTYESAFKLDDLRNGDVELEGISLVALPDDDKPYKSLLEILRAYSERLFRYNYDRDRKQFLSRIQSKLDRAAHATRLD